MQIVSKLQYALKWIKWTASFYTMTTVLIERVSLTLFFTRFWLVRLIPTLKFQEDSPLIFHKVRYIVGLRSTEIDTVEEFYQQHLYDRVDDFLPHSQWTVFDIGANCGMFTIKYAQEGAHVYAFEPNPDCFRRLAKAVGRNKLRSRVSLYNLALGAESGFGTMDVPSSHLYAQGTPAGIVVRQEDQEIPSTLSVNIVKLDKMTEMLNLDYIDLVKIDVEGAEIDVLRGAPQTLAKADRMIVEYHSYALLQEARDLLTRFGFMEVALAPLTERADAGLIYVRKASNITTAPV